MYNVLVTDNLCRKWFHKYKATGGVAYIHKVS